MPKINVKKKKVNIHIAGTRIYPQLEDLEITPKAVEQNFKSTMYGYNNVKVKPIELLLQDKEVTPTEEMQEITNDIEYDALKKVVVKPIPNNYNETSDATATENDIASGKTAYVKGEKIIGTLENDNNAKIMNIPFTSTSVASYIEKLPVIDCSKLTNLNSFFNGYNRLKKIEGLVNTENITTTTNMFSSAGSQNGSEDILEIPLFDTSNVTSMNSMFSNSGDANIPLLNTSKVTSMNRMFQYSGVKNIPLFDTSNVTNMEYMFAGSKAEEIPLLNTSNVTSMASMFSGSHAKEIPLFDTSNVTNMSGMFHSARAEKIALFDTSNVTNMTSLFEGNQTIKYPPLFDTSNVTSMNSMFRMAYEVIEIPSYNTEKVTNFGSFLYDSATGSKFKLQKIGVLDMRSATTLPHFGYAFKELTDLGGFPNLGMAFDPSKAENSYNLRFGYMDSPTMSPPLTRESILNVLNGLYDIASLGCNPQKIQFYNATTDGKITDEDIAIATNKGWNVVIS